MSESARVKWPRFEDQGDWQWEKLDQLTFLEKFYFLKSMAPVQSVRNASEAFKFYFDDYIMSVIVTEINVYMYAATFIKTQMYKLKPRSRVRNWKDVDSDEVYVLFAMQVLMWIHRMPIVKSYFSKNLLFDTSTRRVHKIISVCKYCRCSAAVTMVHLCAEFVGSFGRHGRHLQTIEPLLRLVLCVYNVQENREARRMWNADCNPLLECKKHETGWHLSSTLWGV
jgi:hypothetical protein